MKKVLLIALVAGLLAATAFTQTVPLKESGTSLYAMASGWGVNNFKEVGAGLNVGFITSIDKDRGIFLRVGYSSLNFGVDRGGLTQSVQAMPGLTWYVGKKWVVWVSGGLAGYTTGENSGADALGGIGFSRRIWTSDDATKLVPANLDLFAEVLFTDGGGQPTGSFGQINFGIKLGKAE